MPKEERKQSFMQAIMTLMLSQVVIKIFGLVYKLYLTNKEGFGDSGNAIYSAGFQIYALIITISCVGIPNAVSKLISEKQSIGDYRGAQKIFKVAFAMLSIVGFLGSIFLFLNARTIATKWLELSEAELSLIILAPSIFFESIIAVFRGYFNGHQNMRPMAQSQTVEQIAKTVLTVIIVEIIYVTSIKNISTQNMAAGANLATTFATFISFLLLFKIYLKNRKEDKIFLKNNNKYFRRTRTRDVIKAILIMAMPMTLSAILGSLNKNIDSVTVVRGLKNFLTEAEAQIQYGILSGKVDTLIMFPLSFNIAFATTLIPTISAEKAKGHIESIKRRVSFSLLINMIIGLPCCVGMIIFAEPILKMLFPNASGGALILQVSSISIIFLMLEQTINGTLQGLGKTFAPVISLGIGVTIKFIINLTCLKINPNEFILGGVIGAAFGTVMCHIVSMSISLIQLRKYIKFEFKLSKYILKPIIATTIMTITSTITYNFFVNMINTNISMLITLIVAIITYIISIFAIKIFNYEEILMLPFGKNIAKHINS